LQLEHLGLPDFFVFNVSCFFAILEIKKTVMVSRDADQEKNNEL
jgi:hypothetical protein